MRFIGNKELIVGEIKDLLAKKGLLNTKKTLKLFDAFCGTGAVSNSLKDSFDLVVNDLLNWSVLYTRGRVTAKECKFDRLGFDPFEFLNSNKNTSEGFFFKNYSPGESERMYFSSENAGRIDYFREIIEKWKTLDLINTNEYAYLLASLIESISYVSNTAGVYGAFLKHWDSRSKKSIVLQPVESKDTTCLNVEYYNNKIENIIEEIECDILYLDPPYTQNQYGTQYHLLETLILNDHPSISPITGSRPTAPMRSDWSKDYKTHILFDRLISKTKAKYIIFSYSVDGFMSKSFIEACLKRYGKTETYICKKILYNKYKNFKSRNTKDHFEYLFFIEKKSTSDIRYESPLNYIGSKAKMIAEIKHYLPEKISTFIDAFGGGFNVGINSNANHVIYNDINHFVKDLVKSFNINDTYQYILYLKRIIKKYNLTAKDAESYTAVRDYYNSLPVGKRDPKLLYCVILYGFNQQIRFNGSHNFNNPVGMRWFNDKVLEKMISFSRVIKEKNIDFESIDYQDLLTKIDTDSFVYLDPPYRLTNGSYNDGKRGFKGWGLSAEKRMFQFIDGLNERSVRFMLSYVIEHKGNINEALKEWMSRNHYRLIHVKQIPGIQRKEILIINYGQHGITTFCDKKQVSERRTVSGLIDFPGTI